MIHRCQKQLQIAETQGFQTEDPLQPGFTACITLDFKTTSCSFIPISMQKIIAECRRMCNGCTPQLQNLHCVEAFEIAEWRRRILQRLLKVSLWLLAFDVLGLTQFSFSVRTKYYKIFWCLVSCLFPFFLVPKGSKLRCLGLPINSWIC